MIHIRQPRDSGFTLCGLCTVWFVTVPRRHSRRAGCKTCKKISSLTERKKMQQPTR